MQTFPGPIFVPPPPLATSPHSSVEQKAIPPSNIYFDFLVRHPWCLCFSYLFLFIGSFGLSIAAYGFPVLELAFVGMEARGDGLAFGSLFGRIIEREVSTGSLMLNGTQATTEIEPQLRYGIMEPSNMVLWYQSDENILTPDFVRRSCEAGRTLRRKCVDHTNCHVCEDCYNGTLFTIASAIHAFFPLDETFGEHPESCEVSQDTIVAFRQMMDTCYDNVQRQNVALCKSSETWDLIFSYAVPLSWKPNTVLNETAVVVAMKTLEIVGEKHVVEPHASEMYADVLRPVVDTQNGLVEGVSVYNVFGKGDIFLASVMHELLYAILATAIVFCIVLWHTRSLFVSAGGFVVIFVSLCGTGSIYHLTVPFWPFLNLLLAFVCIAIGVDDIFVYMDTWAESCTALSPETPLANRVAWTTKKAASSMFVTTATDAAAFYANIASPVTTLRVFGIFSGLAITFNYILLMLIMPCFVTITSRGWVATLDQRVNRWLPFGGAKSASGERRIDLFFGDKLGAFVYKARLPLALFFFAEGVGLIPVVLMFEHSTATRTTFYIDSHPLERWDSDGYTRFEFSETKERLNVAVVFGVLNHDNGNQLLPISDNPKYKAAFPTLEYVPLDADPQYLMKLCDEAKTQVWFPPFVQDCPVHHYTSPHKDLKLMTLSIPTTIPIEGSFSDQDTTVKEIDAWIQPRLDIAPDGMKGGWWYPHGFKFYTLKKGLGDGVVVSLAISICIAFVVLLATSWNFLASIVATLAMAFSVMAVIACMVAAGWSLDIIESIILALAVGFSVDFTCHLSHAYMHSYRRPRVGMAERELRVRAAAGNLGVSVSMAALTSFVAGCVMVLTVSRNYYEFGLYMIWAMTLSWTFAFLFFLPVMGLLGPVSKRMTE